MDANWRDTMRPARFFLLDARGAIGLAVILVHATEATLGLGIFIMIVFYALEQRGFSAAAAMRAFRSWLIGNRRPAVSPRVRSHYSDFGGLESF